jgi:hypothetical protein
LDIILTHMFFKICVSGVELFLRPQIESMLIWAQSIEPVDISKQRTSSIDCAQMSKLLIWGKRHNCVRNVDLNEMGDVLCQKLSYSITLH